jgi:hypothetical protein
VGGSGACTFLKSDRRHATMRGATRGLAPQQPAASAHPWVVRGAQMLVMMGMLLVGACGGGEDDAADTAPASTNGAGKPIVIRTKILVAAPERWTRYGIRISASVPSRCGR